MNRQLKKRIKKVFEAPEPDLNEKEKFLRMLPQPQISMLKFILIQASYIRKQTLFLSMLLLFPALKSANNIRTGDLWVASAFIPFLGLLAVAESTRSTTYGMGEFEMATRFSLKSTVLARMSVLGLLDAFIFCCFIPLCCINSSLSIIQTGVYLLVPYLLTVNISLWISRHFHGKEVIYACMSVAAMVSGVNVALCIRADYVYQFNFLKWWLILSALLVGEMIYETYRTIKQTEELAWNL
ncbi:MAG: hypothetical protein K2K21_10405 [Lachnospiraceae bacterium]|nr:hypothetical protein [Lachnospiraceae bacterium]